MIEYDPEADALYIKLSEEPVIDTEEKEPGIMVDYDKNRQVVGLEVLRLSRRMQQVVSASEMRPAPTDTPHAIEA